jgi:hypothetical protein
MVVLSASKTRQSLGNGRDTIAPPYLEAILAAQKSDVGILKWKIRQAALVSDEGFWKADVAQDLVDLLLMSNDLVPRCDLHASLAGGSADTRRRHLVYYTAGCLLIEHTWIPA